MTTLCPTCGQRPSERGQILRRGPDGQITLCGDPIHDLADRAPEMAEALATLVDQVERSNAVDDHGHKLANLKALADARAALAAAHGEEVERG